MCGIAGAIGHVDPAIVAAVERAHAAQVHRGPDAAGVWLEPGDPTRPRVFFAFRRLAILDLSADGNQPMIHPESGAVIVFNGEIYNHLDLRSELERAGAHFSTRSDTEVLLEACVRWGPGCVERLRGMFAFAFYDRARGEVLLARDRLGKKPLYVCTLESAAGSTLLFASELRALLASGLVERRLDRTGLATYLWNGFVAGEQSIVAGVHLLPAGTFARVPIARPALTPQRYWTIPSPPAGGRDPAALRRRLEESVRLRLVSDVPLGVFLSGGIDSSAVASLAVRADVGPVRTFTIGFDEEELDESPHARAVAQGLGTQHEEIRLDARTFQGGLEDALRSIDQPTFDALNTFFVSRAVRRAGITVALAGTGGDELFGGYRSFADIPRARRWSRLFAPLPEKLVRRAAQLVARTRTGPFGAVPPQTRWGKLGDALATRGSLVALYQVSYALYSQEFLRELARDGASDGLRFGLAPGRFHELESLAENGPLLSAIAALELSSFISERLMRDTDAASMSVSLEVRVPLLDHLVVEEAAALDPRLRFHPLGRKQLLRDLALDGLDPAIFEREKSGFVLPFERWCRESLKGEVGALLMDQAACSAVGLDARAVSRLWSAFQAGAPGIYWSRVWALFVLAWWCREHRVRL